jgi:hypothetical protein
MNQPLAKCVNCKSPLPQEFINTPDFVKCPSCATSFQIIAFPAFYKQTDENIKEIALEEGEASCFYHHDKRASIVCHMCGRFLCSLCDIELDEKHICPECIKMGKKMGTITNLENHRVLYDSIAFALALYPLIIFFLATIITAPIALYISLRYWKSPGSMLRGTKIHFLGAIILSLIQIGGWLIFIFELFSQ